VGDVINEQIWSAWLRHWEWTVSAIKQKGYEATLEIAPPVVSDALERLVQDYGLVLPVEFTHVLVRFSARVQLTWHIGKPLSIRPPDDVPELYKGLFPRSGAGDLWDADTLLFLWQRYAAWIERFEEVEAEDRASGRIDPEDHGERGWHLSIWQNKSPFLAVGNGDLLAFDLAHESQNCPVVYLDHEWGRYDGCRLGLNFVDFVSRWSRLGCPAPSSLRRFYDPDRNLLMDSGDLVANWKQWLNVDRRQGVLPLE
jgi:hypothetical protein